MPVQFSYLDLAELVVVLAGLLAVIAVIIVRPTTLLIKGKTTWLLVWLTGMLVLLIALRGSSIDVSDWRSIVSLGFYQTPKEVAVEDQSVINAYLCKTNPLDLRCLPPGASSYSVCVGDACRKLGNQVNYIFECGFLHDYQSDEDIGKYICQTANDRHFYGITRTGSIDGGQCGGIKLQVTCK